MSLFPFWDNSGIQEENTSTDVPIFKEVAWDYKDDKPIVENGDFKIIEGLEAVKTWAYKTLKVERYKYDIYSWDYGHELEKLMGTTYSESYINSEVLRYVQEALLINSYITSINEVDSKIVDGILHIDVKIDTVYGKAEVKV